MRSFISVFLIFVLSAALVTAGEIGICKQQVSGTNRIPSLRTAARSHVPVVTDLSLPINSAAFAPLIVTFAIDPPSQPPQELTRSTGSVPARAPPQHS
jgi:hypothetical protein